MTVVVGMSGGVDSSLSAALLKEQGYTVIGLFMKNWEEADANGVCMASREYEDVVRTCDLLQIPCYSVNFVEEYRNRVFDAFLEDLRQGNTPNPDILCNREIKFDVFLKKAMDLGADFLATGHYACLDDQKRLLKGIDPDKDQTYFLHAVRDFQKVLFPIGHLRKKEVRELARKFRLPTAEKKDSTGICFIGKRDFKPFVSQYISYRPGDFQRLNGDVVGRHDGAAYYTIGQRKGLGLGGEGEAWFVIEKDISRNIVYVERGENHPELFHDRLVASQFTWIGQPPSLPFRCKAKIRYRQIEQPCVIDQSTIIFDTPQRAITPGQAIVFYDGDICLGGATIVSRSRSSL
ncbi:MAG TPA: tRNA 2-thiouridine(34) synthase MnmA [Chlamydiales bacterium]|nr:tRNA 2-thiouridine(34) synthase MnmA [Chlamydiales bacterium]